MTTQVVRSVATDVVAGLLGAGFNGAIRLPGEAEYDVQRRSVIPTVDSRPMLIAEAYCRTDVQAAVRTAREYGLPIAVQATGHGTRVPADGGILLKTTPMTSVLIDPERRIAKVAPGARWGAVIDAAGQFGLAPLSGSSRDVGVTGYTLGGGVGWLARKYGFAADSVIRAEVVTADGRFVTAGAEHHRTSSGRSAAAPATSASLHRWSSGCTRSARSTPASCTTASTAQPTSCAATASGPPRSPTS